MNWGMFTGYEPNGAPYEITGNWGLFASHIRGYMKRLLLKTPWGYVRLHWILRADAGRDLHDHPFDFTSLILRGGYTEETERVSGERTRSNFRAGDVVRRKAELAHSLVAVLPGTLTLVFGGKKRKEWGFWTNQGWVMWKQYFKNA